MPPTLVVVYPEYMAKVGLVGVALLIAQLGAGCGGSNGNGTGNGGQGASGLGGVGGSGTGTGGSYGWVDRSPTAAYTVNAIWGDRSNALWAVTQGGQLLQWDGATWEFVFGGLLPPFFSIWGLPGQTDIYFVGRDAEFYQIHGQDVFDLSDLYVGSDHTAVWAARGDQVWIGSEGSGGGGLRRFDLTLANPTYVSEGPSDLPGVLRIWGANADDVWVIDGDGALAHRVNQAWTRVTSFPIPDRLTGIHGRSSNDIWAVGPHGLWHWNGAEWSEVYEGQEAGLTAVWAAGPNEAWVVSDIGWTVHVTLTSFKGVPSGTTMRLNAVWGTSPTDIWIGGDTGLMLHYEPSTGSTPDPGPCKARYDECGPGECCAPYNCRVLAGFAMCG